MYTFAHKSNEILTFSEHRYHTGLAPLPSRPSSATIQAQLRYQPGPAQLPSRPSSTTIPACSRYRPGLEALPSRPSSATTQAQLLYHPGSALGLAPLPSRLSSATIQTQPLALQLACLVLQGVEIFKHIPVQSLVVLVQSLSPLIVLARRCALAGRGAH